MERHRLNELLKKIHTELHEVKTLDAEERDLLRDLMSDIQGVLDQKEDQPPEGYLPLGDRLEDAVRRFEVRHPGVTATVRQFIDTLPK